MQLVSHMRRAHYTPERFRRVYERAMRLYMRRTGWRPTRGPLIAAVPADAP